MTLLKIFSLPLTYVSSPFFIPNLRFCLFIASYISWMLSVRSFLNLRFALTNISISSIMSSVPEILSCLSCVLLVKLPFVVPVQVPKFFISKFPLVFIFFTDSASIFRKEGWKRRPALSLIHWIW